MVKRGSPCIKMTGKAKFPVAEGETCIVLNGDAVSTSFMYKRLKKSKSIKNSGITTKRRNLPDSIGLLFVSFSNCRLQSGSSCFEEIVQDLRSERN